MQTKHKNHTNLGDKALIFPPFEETHQGPQLQSHHEWMYWMHCLNLVGWQLFFVKFRLVFQPLRMDVHPIMEVLEVLPFWSNEMTSMTYRGPRVPQSNIEYKSKTNQDFVWKSKLIFQVFWWSCPRRPRRFFNHSASTSLFTPSAHDGTLTLCHSHHFLRAQIFVF